MARISLVVPCYDEEHRLNLDALRVAEVTGHELALSFVDDGSNDRTAEVLAAFVAERPEQRRLLRLTPNRGKAEAVRQGFVAALERAPDYVGFWDADLATPLAELDRFVEILEERPSVQMVFGARVKLLGRSIERRPARHYLGRVFATTVSLALQLPIYDTQCGAKVFRVSDTLTRVFADPFLSRWIFDVEIIARYKHLTGDSLASAIYELPLRTWHDVKGTKLRPSDFLRAMIDLWRIRGRYLRS